MTHLHQPRLEHVVEQFPPLCGPVGAEDLHRKQLLPHLQKKSQTHPLTSRNAGISQGLRLTLVSGFPHSPQCSSGRTSHPWVPSGSMCRATAW